MELDIAAKNNKEYLWEISRRNAFFRVRIIFRSEAGDFSVDVFNAKMKRREEMENLVIVKRRSAKRTENYSLSIFNL
jgi:hypothetical protein